MAKKMGRHFLGIELSKEYCKILTKRLAAVEPMPHTISHSKNKPTDSKFSYFNVLDE